MLFYFSPERRRQAAFFDSVTETTDGLLRDYRIALALGPIAAELAELNDNAFLPNFRHGQFVTPPSQKNTLNVAVAPLSTAQALQASHVIDPILDNYKKRPITETVASERYGIYNIPVSIGTEKLDTSSVKDPRQGLKSGTLARTMTRLLANSEDGFGVSRPVIAIRRSLEDFGQIVCGATLAHELVHASDILTDGIAYVDFRYGAASECRARSVDSRITKIALGSVFYDTSNTIESMRIEQIGMSRYPYTPNGLMSDIMLELGAL